VPTRAFSRPRPKTKEEERTISVPGARGRIVVVADTHSSPHPRTHELVAREEPLHILHAGDIGDLAVVDALARIAPTTAVRGNIDARIPGLPDVVRIHVDDGTKSLLEILLLHIAVAGPRLRSDAATRARASGASLVVCGHSHVPFVGSDRGLVMFNPGSVGPRRFHLPILFGVIDVTPEKIRLEHVSCETGERWLPP
jgi:uncharacterized protein